MIYLLMFFLFLLGVVGGYATAYFCLISKLTSFRANIVEWHRVTKVYSKKVILNQVLNRFDHHFVLEDNDGNEN